MSKYFQLLKKFRMKTAIVLTVENTENLKIVKHHIFSIKH